MGSSFELLKTYYTEGEFLEFSCLPCGINLAQQEAVHRRPRVLGRVEHQLQVRRPLQSCCCRRVRHGVSQQLARNSLSTVRRVCSLPLLVPCCAVLWHSLRTSERPGGGGLGSKRPLQKRHAYVEKERKPNLRHNPDPEI